MSEVFQNTDPSPPHRPASVYPPAFGAEGGHTRWVERGWGVNILEDARHCSVLKAVNREDKRSRRYRDRHFAKFERSRRYRDR
jgi:hypothetical protein